MTTEQEFYNKLAEVLNKQFPKGGCKERGAALALNALANVFLQDALKEERDKIKKDLLAIADKGEILESSKELLPGAPEIAIIELVRRAHKAKNCPHKGNCLSEKEMLGRLSDYLNAFLQSERGKATSEECKAWLSGERCKECGNKMSANELCDTCPSCLENN